MQNGGIQEWYSSLFLILRKIDLGVSPEIYSDDIFYLYERSKISHFL